MAKYRDFEDYLQHIHGRQHPEVLDDDVPDHYEEWLADLDINDVIVWANEYAKIANEKNN